jgi:hypothetical protein
MKTGVLVTSLVVFFVLSCWLGYDDFHLRSQVKHEQQEAESARNEADHKIKSGLAQLTGQLEEAKEKIARLNNEIAFPIEIACKKSHGGNTYSVELLNTTTNVLPVTVTFTNPALHKGVNFIVKLTAGFSREVSQLEGWSAAAGDSLQVECPGFLPITRHLQ